jgi:hypothetical protein
MDLETTPKPYPLPTVHLNGTGRQMLKDGYRAAGEAVHEAIFKLSRVEFNARDYYVQDADAYSRAREKRDEMFAKLREVEEYLQHHLEAVSLP